MAGDACYHMATLKNKNGHPEPLVFWTATTKLESSKEIHIFYGGCRGVTLLAERGEFLRRNSIDTENDEIQIEHECVHARTRSSPRRKGVGF